MTNLGLAGSGVKKEIFKNVEKALSVIIGVIGYAIFNEETNMRSGKLRKKRKCISDEYLILGSEERWQGSISIGGMKEDLDFPKGGAVLYTLSAGTEYVFTTDESKIRCMVVKKSADPPRPA